MAIADRRKQQFRLERCPSWQPVEADGPTPAGEASNQLLMVALRMGRDNERESDESRLERGFLRKLGSVPMNRKTSSVG